MVLRTTTINNISVDSNYENVINHNRNYNGIDSDNVRTNDNDKS